MIARKGEWLTADINGETMMMNVSNGRYLGLNAMGTRIWALIEQPRDLDWVCGQLRGEFDVAPEQCRREVEAFVAELVELGAATVAAD